MSTIVGSLAAELGLDTAKFEEGLKKIPGLTSQHMNAMSAEMKRTSKEGAESLRLIDEAFGIHISRPIARIVTQEFPGLAKAFQSLLGAGVTLGIAAAAFDFTVKAIERVTKAIEDAKRKELEFQSATRNLNNELQNMALSHVKQMAQYQAQLDELTGNKGGALQERLTLASVEDAEGSISKIDAITAAIEREAVAAQEASAWTTRFWLAVAGQSVHSVEGMSKDMEAFAATLRDASRYDALHQTNTGLELAKQRATELENQLRNMEQQRISSFRAFAEDDAIKAYTNISHRSGFTDEEINAKRAELQQAKETSSELQFQVDLHQKHLELIKQQSAASADVGEKELAKLKAATEAQLALAGAVSQSVVVQRLQQASGEADEIISRILTEAHGKLTSAIKAELAVVHALTAERDIAKDAVQLNSEMLKETESFNAQIDSIKCLGEAYKQGGDAIGSALIEKQLEADKQKVAEYTAKYEALVKAANDYAAGVARLGNAAGPVEGIQGVDPAAVAQLKVEVDNANASLAEHRRQLEQIRALTYTEEINKTADALRGEKPLQEALNDAQLKGTEAIREATVALALYHWEQAHPGQTIQEAQAVIANPNASKDERDAAQTRIDQIKEENDLLNQQSIAVQRASDAKAAAQYSIGTLYDDELAKLNRIREVIQQNGQSTLLIDAKIQDAQDALNHQWDEAAIKVGTFGDKTKAVFNELVIQGHQAGAEIAKAFLSAFDSAETDLAKLLTGQKVDAAKIAQNLAEQVTKAEIQKGVGALAQHFPGLDGVLKSNAPLGSSSTNPMFVSIVNALETPGDGSTGFTFPSSAISDLFPSVNSGLSGISDFASRFAGAFASGGDLTPGKPAIVGEKGPEMIELIGGGAHITSNADMRASANTYHGHVIHNTFNYNGADSSDLFKRTTKQNAARQARDLMTGLRKR